MERRMKPGMPRPDQADPRRQDAAEDLFDRVRTLPLADRDAAIDAATDDAWVRDEVRSLLRFDTPAARVVEVSQDRGLEAEACIGLAAGGFILRRVIGVGGMSTVFEAEQQLPMRRIAVKVLHDPATRKSTLDRFRREGEFLARLDHANIARVIAAGSLELPNGAGSRPYFAMELVEGGRTITQWARDEGVGHAAIAGMLAKACDAVGSGHLAGIAHLDLKPGNLLVSRSGALRVIDYGIARSLDATDEARDAPFAGTPQYMSPEQFTRGARVDSRTDVYALGLILYELLGRRLPYETHGQPLSSIARTVRETEPTPLGLVDSGVPADLAAIARKAMSKQPDGRYGTALELADDLRRWLADEPVLAAPQRLGTAALRAIRRNPGIAALAAVTLVAIIAAALFATMLAVERSREAERALRDAARANLAVASASIALKDPAGASSRLREIPESSRGWEARHLERSVSAYRLLSQTANEVYSVKELPESNLLVAGVTGGSIQIIDLAGRAPAEEIDLLPVIGSMTNASFPAITATPDGSVIVANLLGGSLIRYDRATRSARLLPFGAGVRAEIAGEHIVCVDPSAGVEVHELGSGRLVAQLPQVAHATDASFSRDARTVVIGIEGGRLRCVDISADHARVTERWRTAARAAGTRAVAISPDATAIAVAWNDGRIARISTATGETEAQRDLDGGSVFDLVIAPDNMAAAASSWANDLRIIDLRTLGLIDRFGDSATHVWNIAWGADGKSIYGRIVRRIEDPDAGAHFADFVGLSDLARRGAVRDIDFGRTLAAAACNKGYPEHVVATEDGRLSEFDPRSGSIWELGRINGVEPPGGISALARMRGPRDLIAAGDSMGRVWIGEVVDRRFRTVAAVGVADSPIRSLCFSPDGSLLACGTEGSTVAMIDVASAKVAWSETAATGRLIAGRARIGRPIFLDGGRSVTFVTSLVNSPRLVFRSSDGAVIGGRGAQPSYEYSDGILRESEQAFYMLGITGGLTRENAAAHEGPDGMRTFARNGGLLASDSGFTRIFAATRDGTTRVAALDPPEEIMRLDSPTGRPLSLGLDDANDELTLVTSRGVARTWSGADARPSPIPPRPTRFTVRPAPGG